MSGMHSARGGPAPVRRCEKPGHRSGRDGCVPTQFATHKILIVHPIDREHTLETPPTERVMLVCSGHIARLQQQPTVHCERCGKRGHGSEFIRIIGLIGETS